MLAGALGLAKALPVWAWALAACLAWGAVQKHRATAAGAELHRAQAEAAALREFDLQTSIAETTRRLAAERRNTHAADQAAALARADAASAAGAVERLQFRIAADQAAARASDPAAAGAGAADRNALATCAGRYRDVAAAADRAVIAGQACERAYDALTPAERTSP